MRKTQRLATLGGMAALAVALTACGSSPAPPAPAPTTTAAAAPTTSAPAAASDGVTTAAEVIGPDCGRLPQGSAPGGLAAMGPMPVAAAASTNPLLSTLVTAVGKVPGLADTLDAQQAVTVFAPDNGAFDAARSTLGAAAFDGLLADPTKLGDLLSYHVVPVRYDAAGLVAAKTVTELAGGTLTIGGTAAAPTVTDGKGNTAKVLCGNIPTSNATVFVIDKVLMPAS